MVQMGRVAIAALWSSFALSACTKSAQELWPFWDVHDPANSHQVDHTPWQDFLDRYLVRGDDGINRIAYARASGDGGRERLNGYLSNLTALDPRSLNNQEQLAYFINLYNALTVEVIFRYPQKDSILYMGGSLFSTGPWDDKLVTIAGQAVTLNDIEHRILRPIWRDRRIHFALNCASLGCPNLRKTAFRAENTDTLLSAGENEYINHPRGVHFDQQGNLVLSGIFAWYQADFADDDTALLAYLARHHSLENTLSTYDGEISYDYDWALNGQTQP